jgi:hypothetical protein
MTTEVRQREEEVHPVLYQAYYLSDIDITMQRMPVVLKIIDGCTRCRKLLIQQEIGDCK